MGLLDFLFGSSKCPRCGTRGARKSQGQTRCPNPSCPFFDINLRTAQQSSRSKTVARLRGDFSPESPLEIQYRNFRGEDKTFTADTSTLRRKNNHIVAQVVPTGQKISLSRDRIQNLEEVEAALPEIAESHQPSGPTARERQVLNYHKKYRSSSPLYEKIRANYPDW
jgi:hypothetical protein